jgi:hypothetical protein
VVIDESVIEGKSKPLLIYENSEPQAKAAPTPDRARGSIKGPSGPFLHFLVSALVISRLPHISSKHHFQRFPATRPL